MESYQAESPSYEGSKGSAYACWKIILSDTESGNIIHVEESPNIVVSGGRALQGYNLFGLAASGTLNALGAGACATAATVTDTQLNYELIGNATRKTLTNTSGALLTSGDIGSTSFSDTFGEPYYQKIVVQTIYSGNTDGNVNQPFQEFGLFTTPTKPSTPTGTSGVMYNHFVANSPVVLTSTTTLTVQITIYW